MAALDEKERDNLTKVGGYVRNVARRSMRIRKAKSPPGSPPSAHAEGKGPLLRDMLFFAFDTQKGVIVVGPAHLGRSIVARLHERGGTQQPVRRKPRKIGQSGPVRIVKEGVWEMGKSVKVAHGDPQGRLIVYAKLTSAKQVQRSESIEEQLYSPLDRKFPPRPFMAPALANPQAQQFIAKLFSKPL